MPVKPLLLVALLVLPIPVSAEHSHDNVDPFEGVNRTIFAFNETLDDFVMRPLSEGYRYVAPEPVEIGVNNFFSNLGDFTSMINAVLQGEFKGAGRAGGRFLINSTLGIGGLFDPASRAGIEKHRADFGQTLGKWGVSHGPYLMVPFLGPRTVRSGLGSIVDFNLSIQNYVSEPAVRNSLFFARALNGRTQLLQAEELISGDRYIFLRDAYLQQRDIFISGAVVEDNFSDFGDEDDWSEDF